MIKSFLKKLKLHDLVYDIVSYGVRRYFANHPHLIAELQANHRAHFGQQLLSQLHHVGHGVCINGVIRVTHPRGMVLGNNVHIGEGGYFHSRGGITIRDNCHLSRNITIYSCNHDYEDTALPYSSRFVDKPVVIEKNVWIGMNVNILPGVTIGEGAIIGMGTTVAKDVPAFSIVGSQPFRILKQRDTEHYRRLSGNSLLGGRDGKLLSKEALQQFRHPVTGDGEGVFFVVGTGRCGSTTIAKLLTIENTVTCLHEPKQHLIKLSTDFAHGVISKAEARSQLQALFSENNVLPDHLYGESDQKLSNMIELLHELYPKARFLWLIRNAKDTVNSTYSRGWFSNTELFRQCGEEPTDDLRYRPEYGQYRPQADRMGLMTSEEWRAMSEFERNCWYWSYWNTNIEQQLGNIPRDLWMQVKLETLQNDTSDIFDFLKLNLCSATVVKTNAAQASRYTLGSANDWSASMRKVFQAWCDEPEQKWYPHIKRS